MPGLQMLEGLRLSRDAEQERSVCLAPTVVKLNLGRIEQE